MRTIFTAAASLLVTAQSFAAPPGTQLGEFNVTGSHAMAAGQRLAFGAAQHPNGLLLAAWRPPNQNAVVARRFNADGSPMKAEFQVNALTPDGEVGHPVVAIGPGLYGAVAWSVQSASDATYTIFLRMVRTSGLPIGPDIEVASGLPRELTWNEGYPPTPLRIALAASDTGDIGIAWGYRYFDATPEYNGVGFKIYRADGTQVLDIARLVGSPQTGVETLALPLPDLPTAFNASSMNDPTLSWRDGHFLLGAEQRGDTCRIHLQRFSPEELLPSESALTVGANDCYGGFSQMSFYCAAPMPSGRTAVARRQWFDIAGQPDGAVLEAYQADDSLYRQRGLDDDIAWACASLRTDWGAGNVIVHYSQDELGGDTGVPAIRMFNPQLQPLTTPIPVPESAHVTGGEARDRTVTLVYPKVTGDSAAAHAVQLTARRYAGPRSQ